jgi:hypothetical protein
MRIVSLDSEVTFSSHLWVSSIGTRAADAALWLAVEILFTHSQQTGRRLALKSKYLIDPNL